MTYLCLFEIEEGEVLIMFMFTFSIFIKFIADNMSVLVYSPICLM